MMNGNFYCLYDTLYEEYQKPFVMPNDKVALAEFAVYRNSLLDKAKDEKEKKNILARFKLMKYEGITFCQADGFFLAKENSIPCYELTDSEDDE